jgi:hypothetical protein
MLMNTNSLPDLSGLKPSSARLALRRFVGAEIHPIRSTYMIIMNSVRLADHGVREYQLARSALLEVGNISLNINTRLAACNHLETMLWALERFTNLIRKLGEIDGTPVIEGIVTNIQLFNDTAERIRKMRNLMAHFESMTQQVKNGQSGVIYPSTSGIEIGKYHLSWIELEQYALEVHQIAYALANFQAKTNEQK